MFVHLENLADFATGDFLEADGVGIDARDDVGSCHVFLFRFFLVVFDVVSME